MRALRSVRVTECSGSPATLLLDDAAACSGQGRAWQEPETWRREIEISEPGWGLREI